MGADHPRGCGEHGARCWARGLGLGSSPRMRGALIIGGGCVAGVGIIPADAGSTQLVQVLAVEAQDHPRGCGEHNICLRCLSRVLGSSPRMRGALSEFLHNVCGIWIIPADAGSTIYQGQD